MMWIFETWLGQLLLTLLERYCGLAIVPVEQLAEERPHVRP